MPTYLLTYHGGDVPGSDEERASQDEAWGEWFATLGPAVLVAGDPIAVTREILPDGSVTEPDDDDPVGGYSVVVAEDLDAALALAADCPILDVGGSVRVGEAVPMG